MPKEKEIQISDVVRKAQITSSSYNETDNTVEVVFATEEKVFVRHWDGDHYQVLRCDKDSIRSARLDNGAVPMVDTHKEYTIDDVIGRVISWEIKGKQCTATVLLASRPEKAGIVTDIKSGVLRNISVKARPWGAIVGPKVEADKYPTYIITDWEPMEISLVAVPADPFCVSRSDNNNNHSINILTQKNSSVMEQNLALDIISRCEKAKLDLTFAKSLIERNLQETEIDAAIAEEVTRRANGNQPPAPAAKPTTVTENVALSIIERCENAGLDITFAKDLIARNLDVAGANAAIVDEIARKHKEANPVTNNGPAAKVTGQDEKDITRTAIQDGLIHRADSNSGIELNEKSRQFRNQSLLDIARNCIIEHEVYRGMSYANAHSMVMGLGKNDVIKRAVATTDYADLLTSTVNRQLRRYYTPATSQWKKLSEQTSVSDFRAKTGLSVDGSVTFEKIAENGEYKSSKIITTEKATIAVDTYGKMIEITRRAIINDDLDALSRIPKYFAQGALNLQADMVFGMITTPAKTPDGKNIFHADHANLVSSGTAMSETTLNDGIVAMGKQKSPAGEILNLAPKYLLVPLEKKMLAQKLMAGITAGTTTDVNTLQGAFEIISDARLSVASATAWYLFAGTEYEGLMHAYLDGEEGIYTESQTNFLTDSIQTKARLEFGVAAWNYRGWYKNVGA